MDHYLLHHFKTPSGFPASAKLRNPDHESIAAFFECDEAAVDFIEAEDGTEIVTVEGKLIGTVEVSA